MNIVFYKGLLPNGLYPDLSHNEKIVYSFLIFKSLCWMDGVFDIDGKIDIEGIRTQLEISPYIDCYKISQIDLSAILNCTRQSVASAYSVLEEHRLLDDGQIYVPLSLIDGGYFKLYPHIGKVRGLTVIFYSYLKNKATPYKGKIDTFKSGLAEEFGCGESFIHTMLNKLYKLKLIHRDEKGNLVIDNPK